MKNPRLKPEERPRPIPAPKTFKDRKKEARKNACRTNKAAAGNC